MHHIYKKLTILFTLTGLLISPLFALAQSNNFYVDPSHDIAGRTTIPSTLQHTSEKAYFFVEDNYYNNLTSNKRSELQSSINNLAQEFDTKIYPTLRLSYGSEWSPGIDNDEKITILLTRMESNVAGYVLFRNEQPRTENPASNEREMIYLNTSIVGSDTAKAHLAHEFVHLIEYNQRNRQRGISEPEWLSEGLADYAPTLLGYNEPYSGSHLESRVNDFLTFPYDSLTGWKDKSVDFATSSLFMHYLVGHHGDSILLNLMQADGRGEDAVNNALERLNRTDTFQNLFRDWTVANYVNGSTTEGEKNYSYNSSLLNFSNLHITSPVQYSMFPDNSISSNFFASYGAANWLKFVPGQLGANGANTLNIKFSTSPTNSGFHVPYIVTDILGQTRVEEINLVNGSGIANIDNFGTSVISVVLAPSHYYKTNNPNPGSSSFTINVSTDNGAVAGETTYTDGSLLRAQGGSKVYVIKNGTKRWIPSAKIFNGYGHLRWEDIIDVDPSVLSFYQDSSLIKFIGDYRVYEVDTFGSTKRHLNITPQQFESAGYRWDAIYEVNQSEFNSYLTGTPKAVIF
ncbi:MAG: hypothetical protein R3346_04340 [Candidatus Spechtbacterales bacterium]|nr:hypothetical protein [Candidatus Spechtbacterales bacterium]